MLLTSILPVNVLQGLHRQVCVWWEGGEILADFYKGLYNCLCLFRKKRKGLARNETHDMRPYVSILTDFFFFFVFTLFSQLVSLNRIL